MSVTLSPVGGVAAQFFSNDGVPLAGGLIYTYLAGTSTPAATYTSASGAIAHSNPIVLDSAGRVPSGEIWLDDAVVYKFVLKDASNVLIATYDNITGINSNFVNYINQQEIQTATAGQTVFTLTTMTYLAGTNSLSVFVDGVNQYGPGAQYAYVETNSTTVTFESGLHVGALVKFTTTQQQSAGVVDASQVTYEPPFAGSATTNVEAKLAQTISVIDFGAVGDGGTDDTVAIQNAINYWVANPVDLVFPSNKNFYVTSAIVATFSANSVLQKRITGYGSRLTASSSVVNALTITVSATATYVRNLVVEGLEFTGTFTGYGLTMQGTKAGTSYLYGNVIRDLVFSGSAGSGLALLGNFFESTVYNCRITASDTGFGIYLSTSGGSGSGSGGVVSSIGLVENMIRGGVNCVYGDSTVNDIKIIGGTYLTSQQAGIKLDFASGGSIDGAHIEKVWLSANSIVAGHASIDLIVNQYFPVKNCTFSQSGGYSSECINVYVGAGSTAQLDPGLVYGISINYRLYGAAGSFAILSGQATYTNLGNIAITTIQGLRTLTPISSKNTYSITSPSTVTPSEFYGVYMLSLNGNVTINAPSFTPADGDELEFTFEQAGGGGDSATWNATYSVGSFVPTSAFGKVSSIRLKYLTTFVNGPQWIVVSTATT